MATEGMRLIPEGLETGSIEEYIKRTGQTDVVTYLHTDGQAYVVEIIVPNKPHKVHGKLEKRLGNGPHEGEDIIRLHAEVPGEFVRISPVSRDVEKEILGS